MGVPVEPAHLVQFLLLVGMGDLPELLLTCSQLAGMLPQALVIQVDHLLPVHQGQLVHTVSSILTQTPRGEVVQTASMGQVALH